jgi:hypothetical protein
MQNTDVLIIEGKHFAIELLRHCGYLLHHRLSTMSCPLRTTYHISFHHHYTPTQITLYTLPHSEYFSWMSQPHALESTSLDIRLISAPASRQSTHTFKHNSHLPLTELFTHKSSNHVQPSLQDTRWSADQRQGGQASSSRYVSSVSRIRGVLETRKEKALVVGQRDI